MKERKRRSVLQSARANGDGMRRPPGHFFGDFGVSFAATGRGVAQWGAVEKYFFYFYFERERFKKKITTTSEKLRASRGHSSETMVGLGTLLGGEIKVLISRSQRMSGRT